MRLLRMLWAVALLFSLPAGAQNLIPNPGFEEGFNTGHNLVAINGSEVVFSGTAEEVFQGDSALKIEVSLVGTGGPQVIGIRHILEGLEAGNKYYFSAAIKGVAGQKFRFRVHGDSKQVMNITLANDVYNIYHFAIDPLEAAADGDHLVTLDFADSDNSASIWYVDSLVFKKADGGNGGEPGTLSVVYVSPDGSDSNEGSEFMPVKTLARASELLAGDTIFLKEGRYHEEVAFDDFSGHSGAPKVIKALPGHEVVFDGTIPVGPAWELHEGHIYKTSLTEDVWQLFVNGEMLNLCRWPNVEGFIEDEQPVAMDPLPLSLWDQQGTWGHSADNSRNGLMIDDGAKGLGSTGLDMTGAIAVLNIGSFKTSAAPVALHIPGEDHFTYDSTFTDPFLTWQKPGHAYYYLEGKLNLLDSPGEWYYDKASKELYVYMKDGSDPSGADVRAKVHSYAMSFNSCDFLELRNINFFGTTIRGISSENLIVENCAFTYPSYSKRILGDYSAQEVTMFTGECSRLHFINNLIQYTEGEALHHDGEGALIENNLMRHIDFSCANLRMLGGTVNFKSDSVVFRNNTIYIAGASETLAPGSFNTVEGNEIWGIGHLQNDGSMVQYMVGPAVGSVTRYNWLHDCKKSGMRYDGSLSVGNTDVEGYWEPWGTQTKGQVYGNVIWNTPTGLMIKGDYHVIVNNTVFDNSKVSIIMMDPLTYEGPNSHSICKNNIGGMISGHRGGKTPDDWPIPGDHSNNWNGYYQEEELNDLLSDINNRDFRPVSEELLIEMGALEVSSEDLFPEHTFIDSTYDIGAYEYGDSIYRIAGRREAFPSHPVPADAAVASAPQIMLAWRPAYRADAYRVYLGSSPDAVALAGPGSPEFLGEQENNMLIPGMMEKGELLFWRVDALQGDQVLTGQLWSFHAGEDSTVVQPDTLAHVRFQVKHDDAALEGAEVELDGQQALTDQFGEAAFNDLVTGKSYTYTVQLAGFDQVEGSVFLEKDTVITIQMQLETGLEPEELLKVDIYPNPANGYVQIVAGEESYRVELINALGRVMLSKVGFDAPGMLDISAIQPGAYMLLITDQKRNRVWERIIITR